MPIGMSKTYNCTSLVGNPWWYFERTDDTRVVTSPKHSSYLQDGVSIPRIGPDDISSTLIITGTVRNNNTEIVCAQVIGNLVNFQAFNRTEALIFQVYGESACI